MGLSCHQISATVVVVVVLSRTKQGGLSVVQGSVTTSVCTVRHFATDVDVVAAACRQRALGAGANDRGGWASRSTPGPFGFWPCEAMAPGSARMGAAGATWGGARWQVPTAAGVSGMMSVGWPLVCVGRAERLGGRARAGRRSPRRRRRVTATSQSVELLQLF